MEVGKEYIIKGETHYSRPERIRVEDLTESSILISYIDSGDKRLRYMRKAFDRDFKILEGPLVTYTPYVFIDLGFKELKDVEGWYSHPDLHLKLHEKNGYLDIYYDKCRYISSEEDGTNKNKPSKHTKSI